MNESKHIRIGPDIGIDGEPMRYFYAVLYSDAAFDDLPWGDEQFDCVILACDPSLASQLAEDIAHDVVQCNVDWVQTTGVDAERMHDLVDTASVRIGRQDSVGDGDPMTAWHEDAVSIRAMADVARTCHGAADYVLLLVIGTVVDLQSVVDEMQRALSV